MIPFYEENTSGTDWVIGDLHGHVTKLREKLARKGFNPAVDRLFAVGDLVDRGPESDRVLELLDEPWFHSVRGNHEHAAIEFACGRQKDVGWYAGIGGGWMIGKTKAEQMEYAVAFECLPIAMEVSIGEGRTVGLVHADCPFEHWHDFHLAMRQFNNLPKLQQNAIKMTALWSRERIDHLRDDGVAGIHAVIVGHTPQERVTSLGNVFYVDTGCGKPGGKLTLKPIKKVVGA
jgi:serine/threonine protein phosphatase 1